MNIMVSRSATQWFVCIFLAGALILQGCSDGKKDTASGKSASEKSADLPFLAETRVLATIGDQEKPANEFIGHNDGAPAQMAGQAVQVTFSDRGNAVAYKAGHDGKQYVVINGKAEPPFNTVGDVVFSPDGRKHAYTVKDENNIWHLKSDARSDIFFHHIGMPVFSPDGRHLAFLGSYDDEWFLVIDNKLSAAGKNSYDPYVFSGDSSKLAYMENSDTDSRRLIIADLDLKTLQVIPSVVSPFAFNADRSKIAAVVSKDGKQRVVQAAFSRPEVVTEGPAYDEIRAPAFSPDGVSLAYLARKGKAIYLVMDGKEELVNSFAMQLIVNPDRKSVGMIQEEANGVRFRQVFVPRAVSKLYDEIAEPVYSRDGSQHAFMARKGKNWCAVVNGMEGPAFDRVVTPLFSFDGSRIVYRARKDGKRFVVVADAKGQTIRQHPGYEQVSSPVFSPDGMSVGYGVKDGNKLVWKVEKL